MSLEQRLSFREKTERGELCLGLVVTLADPTVSELAAETGWDFTWLDLEHAPLNMETALGHLMALRGSRTAPFIRVAENHAATIKPLLELDPAGVIIPMVNSAEEAAAAVSACRYPPQGIRGVGPRRGTGFGNMPLDKYFSQAENNPMVIIQIEHIEAVRNLDQILKVPGLDAICVGPCDLAASMGWIRDMDNPEVARTIDQICLKTKQAGLSLGSAVGSTPEIIGQWRKRGADWLAVASDWGCLASVSRQIIKREQEVEEKIKISPQPRTHS